MKRLFKSLAILELAATFAFAACGGPSLDPAIEAPISNQSDGNHGPTYAAFDGKILNLAVSWGDAQSCVVWKQGGVAECFRTEQEGNNLVSQIELSMSEETGPAAAPNPLLACSRNCLHIYQHSNFGGRDLTFCDRGYWQNLTSYGFNDELSSFKTGSHGVHLAEHTGGGGNWYPGNTDACVSAGGMSSGWNDRVSSIYIR